MGATFSRVKTWIAETLTFSDLNAEIDNILTNLTPAGIDDYSANVAAMQTQTDPGESGSESLATSIAGELERIRFMLKEMSGKTYWYESPATNIQNLAGDIALENNRVESGRVRSTSEQPQFLQPAGAGNGNAADVLGATTNFVYYIAGTQYTISTDITTSSLQTAASSNNTALVDDTALAGAEATKIQGEQGTSITIDTVGSEISSLVGEWAGFKINNGVDDEYFIAYVEDSTTLSRCKRGYFFDDSDAPIPRITINNNDTITLMKLVWFFATTSGTIVVSNSNPIFEYDTPSSPATNQYWFDYANDTWKKWSGTSFEAANATLIGVVCVDSVPDAVGARSFDFSNSYNNLNTFSIDYVSATQVSSRELENAISVYGTTVKFPMELNTWDITSDLESGVSEGASTTYYAYVTEDGDEVLSDVAPYDRNGDLKGWYHPHNTWRAVGEIQNDGSQDFDSTTLLNYGQFVRDIVSQDSIEADAVTTAKIKDLNVTRAKLAAVGPQTSTSSGSATTTSTTYVDIPNLTVSLTTTGRPVIVMFQGTTAIGKFSVSENNNTDADLIATMQVLRDSTVIAEAEMRIDAELNSASNLRMRVPPAVMNCIDEDVAAGTYTYKIQYKVGTNTTSLSASNIVLVAYEL